MAQALAFPSWYEGLGLPLLEAMTCGAPVVASDRGAIPYVVGDAALTCDLDDIPGFSRNLTRVLNDPAEHARLKKLGYERATRFTWDKTAQAYLGFYERVLSDKPAHAVSAPTG
jgi:glycosyltransferase involved in cell wall biosynthesis